MEIGTIKISHGAMIVTTAFRVHVACGCDHHGDHEGCDTRCKSVGCGHKIGADESCNYHTYVHGGSKCPNCGVTFDELSDMMESHYTTGQWR